MFRNLSRSPHLVSGVPSVCIPCAPGVRSTPSDSRFSWERCAARLRPLRHGGAETRWPHMRAASLAKPGFVRSPWMTCCLPVFPKFCVRVRVASCPCGVLRFSRGLRTFAFVISFGCGVFLPCCTIPPICSDSLAFQGSTSSPSPSLRSVNSSYPSVCTGCRRGQQRRQGAQ